MMPNQLSHTCQGQTSRLQPGTGRRCHPLTPAPVSQRFSPPYPWHFSLLDKCPPKLEVAVVTTERAKHFYSPQDIPVTLYSDADEWEMWKQRSDPVLHIDLRRWADLMLVAPLDANTLGKVASGICDNLLTCVIRAWDRRKPLLFCPAMNTAMWEHPITSQQVGQLQAFGYVEIPCVAKKLVCGDQGLGAMAEVDTIVDKVKEVLSQCADSLQS
ncbi:phosphopantothenoylcysteine decarboxylase isoform X3 [Desmodus rotundus]|uniref:phosphopantothenoylcysteine decarboxylase isoform X3 n=1 Tax=Desmodus rotundus TaxID=9430 RepID=UPI001E1BEDE1|nr:phosphopantothenoylcysteine decarboxylase isoform X3 [Desmodus rotundus]